MTYYYKLGQVPHKRHTQFRQTNGALHHEEVMGIHGFAGLSLYTHLDVYKRQRWRSSAKRTGTPMALINAELFLVRVCPRLSALSACHSSRVYERPARRNKTTAAPATTTPAMASHIRLLEEADVWLSVAASVAVAATVDSGSTCAKMCIRDSRAIGQQVEDG